jgi:hypothetical protein
MLAISPRFDETKLSGGRLEDKIDVFEDQILGWLVEPAKLMASSQHSGFSILAVVLAYFEPIGQFLEGKEGGSKAQFTLGMKAVFPAMAASDPSALWHVSPRHHQRESKSSSRHDVSTFYR